MVFWGVLLIDVAIAAVVAWTFWDLEKNGPSRDRYARPADVSPPPHPAPLDRPEDLLLRS